MIIRKIVKGLEQYYTNPDIVKLCVKQIKGLPESRTFLEPSGGTGAFIKELKKSYNNKIISYDLEPKYKGIIKADFLETKLKDKKLFTIGNPPFGRASNIAIKFFNKAALNSDFIAFLIPIAWKRWFTQDKLNPNFHLIRELEMPTTGIFNGPDVNDTGKLKTVFQVWKRKTSVRNENFVEDRKYFVTCSHKKANVAYTSMGWNIGKLEHNIKFKSNTTKIFMKVKNKSVIKALQSIDHSIFSKYSSISESISGKEIRYLLNKYFDGKK